MTDMKISIIITVYNGEEFLKECINSLINQTYKNIEIVVVDDGSTDNTEAIIKSYTDPRIVYYKNSENQKTYESVCRAFEFASGDYITFCDADDMLDSRACEVLLKKAIETNADMVSSNHIKKKGFYCLYYFSAKDLIAGDSLKYNLDKSYVAAKHGSLIKKDIIQRFLKITPRGFKLANAEDFLMFFIIHYLVQYRVHIKNRTYFYRHNTSSVSHSANMVSASNRIYDYSIMLANLKKFLEDNSIYDTYKDEYIKITDEHCKIALYALYQATDKDFEKTKQIINDSEYKQMYLEYIFKGYFKGEFPQLAFVSNKQRLIFFIKKAIGLVLGKLR